jgi:hypothetical protein
LLLEKTEKIKAWTLHYQSDTIKNWSFHVVFVYSDPASGKQVKYGFGLEKTAWVVSNSDKPQEKVIYGGSYIEPVDPRDIMQDEF